MINMISQELLPTIIHCSALRYCVLRFRAKLAESNLKIYNKNTFATKSPRHKGSQSRSNSNKQFCGLFELVFAAFA